MKYFCHFCKKQLSSIQEFETLYCGDCKVKHYFQTSDDDWKFRIYAFSFSATYKNIEYFATFHLQANLFLLSNGKDVVMSLPYLPAINPTNFAQKLPTLLTFS